MHHIRSLAAYWTRLPGAKIMLSLRAVRGYQMSSIEPCPEPDRLAIEGMEHVFAADGAASGPSDGHPDISGEVDQGQDGRVSDALTIQQAVHYFGLPASVIRQKIDREEIAAIRIRGSVGP